MTRVVVVLVLLSLGVGCSGAALSEAEHGNAAREVEVDTDAERESNSSNMREMNNDDVCSFIKQARDGKYLGQLAVEEVCWDIVFRAGGTIRSASKLCVAVGYERGTDSEAIRRLVRNSNSILSSMMEVRGHTNIDKKTLEEFKEKAALVAIDDSEKLLLGSFLDFAHQLLADAEVQGSIEKIQTAAQRFLQSTSAIEDAVKLNSKTTELVATMRETGNGEGPLFRALVEGQPVEYYVGPWVMVSNGKMLPMSGIYMEMRVAGDVNLCPGLFPSTEAE